MGAWIEIGTFEDGFPVDKVAPAWGRGLKCQLVAGRTVEAKVAPAWGRGLKWLLAGLPLPDRLVAPAWGRGLKLIRPHGGAFHFPSPPHGGVD